MAYYACDIVSSLLSLSLSLDGIDYYGASKDVTFGPESVREGECVVVQIIKDEIVENDETFIIGLSSSLEGSAVILEPIKVASITILDDDGQLFEK